jgi:hypothetical protein
MKAYVIDKNEGGADVQQTSTCVGSRFQHNGGHSVVGKQPNLTLIPKLMWDNKNLRRKLKREREEAEKISNRERFF